MRMMIRRSFCSIVLALALFLISGHAQGPEAASPAASATIAAKKPVFAGACKACPWGILARVTADALSYYGHQTTICWVCWSSFGPREMGDKTKPVMPPGAESNAEYIEPPPDAVPDIGATSESNLIDAWNGSAAVSVLPQTPLRSVGQRPVPPQARSEHHCPKSKLEVAYHKADKAIQSTVELLAAA